MAFRFSVQTGEGGGLTYLYDDKAAAKERLRVLDIGYTSLTPNQKIEYRLLLDCFPLELTWNGKNVKETALELTPEAREKIRKDNVNSHHHLSMYLGKERCVKCKCPLLYLELIKCPTNELILGPEAWKDYIE